MDASERRRLAAAEAARWFVRLQSGDMQRHEREQFVDWLRESHVHVAEILRVAQVHGALEQFDHWTRISTEGAGASESDTVIPFLTADRGSSVEGGDTEAEGVRFGRRRSRRTALFALAAAVAVVAVGAGMLLPGLRGQIIDTGRGERREVVLSDGSTLEVDPQTRLRIRYGHAVRLVLLEHGRALFRVARSPNRPFLVKTDETTVRAVGTAFGVEQQPQGVVVTVSEGKVAVIPTGREVATSSSDILSQKAVAGAANEPAHMPVQNRPAEALVTQEAGAVFLIANQQVTVQRSGSTDRVREVDSSRELAWAEGRLIFRNEQVSKVVAEFNRYNTVQLTVDDPVIARRMVSGVFNASEPEAFIAFLQTVAPVEITRDGAESISIGPAQSH